jgi:SPP1 gp7 family putative phage head morphogenesis protein
MGLVYPNERVIENLVNGSQDSHKLISRKAGAPIHAKFGQPGEQVAKSSIDEMKTSLQYMNNRTEWVTDGNVEFKILDFGPIGDNLSAMQQSDIRELLAGMDCPEVLLNSGQLNEGIARVQLEGWDRKIISYRDLIEGVIVLRIFKPYLEGQGLSAEDIDFIWNLPGQTEINNRLTQLNAILGNMSASENMKRICQLEIARLLNIQEASEYLPQPEKGLDEQAFKDKQDANLMGAGLQPTENKPYVEPNKVMDKKAVATRPKECSHTHIKEAETLDMATISIREWLNLQEANGFSFSDYLMAILKQTKIDSFEQLKAITEADIEKGLLSEADIEKLRTILKEGFRRNMTLRQVEQNIKEGINMKDRITEDGKTIPAETRPESIARTETLRLSAVALHNLYEENNINKYQFLSSPGACEICQELDNGQTILLMEANSGVNYPPIHPNCRCFPLAVR